MSQHQTRNLDIPNPAAAPAQDMESITNGPSLEILKNVPDHQMYKINGAPTSKSNVFASSFHFVRASIFIAV
jgi:hypothetical protein